MKPLLSRLITLCLSLFMPFIALAKDTPPPPDPVVELVTTLGTIRIELFEQKDPVTVKNFLQYVKSGYYNNTIFHRIIDGFVIQGGGYNSNFEIKPGTLPPISNQAKLGLKNTAGTVAMARKANDPNSATSQFFINLTDNNALNHSANESGYAVFGRVVSGMDVVSKIARIKVGQREGLHNVPFYPEEAQIQKVSLVN